MMVAGISTTAPAVAAPKPAPAPGLQLRFLHVVDEQGHPFRAGTAGVIASTQSGQTVGTADTKGVVRLVVKPLVKYQFFGFARNTGWGCGWVNPDGTGTYFFSDKIQKYGLQLLLPTTFIVRKPNCSPPPTPGPTATVLNGDTGSAFPVGIAGLMACTHGACVFAGTDGNGVAQLTNWTDTQGVVQLPSLDPNVVYTFTGWAQNPAGWDTTCAYTPDAGVTNFFFSPNVTGHLSDVNGTQFVISQPDCPPPPAPGPTATVLNGDTGSAFPIGIAGLMACTGGTCVFAGTDANGVARLRNWTDNQGVVQIADLDPNVVYTFTGWVFNPPGWDTSCAYTEGAKSYFFSANVTGHLSDVNGTQFVVSQPDCPPPPTPGPTATVLNGETGTAFPFGTAGLMACTGATCVFAGADTNGVVHLTNWTDDTGAVQLPNLDPNVVYTFSAWVFNPPGWDTTCAYTEGAKSYFFNAPSSNATGNLADVENTVFSIPRTTCPPPTPTP